jgi:2-oxo-3-hexenedioate decarboxylase
MDIEAIGRELADARRSARLTEAPSRRYQGFSLEDGYAVGQLLQQWQVASGAAPIGVKLGFTNQAVWQDLGLDRPFWAPIYDTTVTDSHDVSLLGLVAPRIEPEVVLGFRDPVRAGASPDEIRRAIGWAAPGFEIVQCHYPGWEMAPPDAVADAGLHGVLVVGEHRELGNAELGALDEVDVELRREETVFARGRSANALGGPIQAVSWLQRLPGSDELRAGAIVTTGTLTAAFPIAAGERWQLRTAGPVTLGELAVSLSDTAE